MKLLKIIFLADRYHIRKYLRPVTGDRYVAMENGPVASFLYNVFMGRKSSEGQIRKSPDDGYVVVAGSKEPQYQFLSETDREALDFAAEKFGRFDRWKLRDLVHAFPEWVGKSEGLKAGKVVDMDYFDFLMNADPKNPEFKKLRLDDPYEPIEEEEREFLREEMLAGANQVT